jgi:ATP-dependent Clp protease ATP-binding subunit ClpA
MRRSIQKLVEDRLAEEFLNKRFDDGDTVTVDAGNGELTFSKTSPADETP